MALLHDPKFLALLLRIDHDWLRRRAPMAARAGVCCIAPTTRASREAVLLKLATTILRA